MTPAPRVAAASELAAEAEAAEDEAKERHDAEGPRSPLALLKGKREEITDKLWLDLKVPRWEETLGRSVWVRYGPSSPSFFGTAAERRERAHKAAQKKGAQGEPDWLINANADLLVESCIAIFDLAIGEEPPDEELEGNFPTFASEELSESLGVSKTSAATACRALYLTEGDLLIASGQLMEWSGQESKKGDEAFLSS